MNKLSKLKINFFAGKGDFLDESILLEKMLKRLDENCASHRTGGIAQFRLTTELSIGAVREKIGQLSLSGRTDTNEEDEEENDEMSMA